MRRLNVRSIRHAKNLAKTLKTELADLGYNLSLSATLELTAATLGYSSWHELISSDHDGDGPFDEELSIPDLIDRRRMALKHLQLVGVREVDARVVLGRLSLTGKDTRHPVPAPGFDVIHESMLTSGDKWELPENFSLVETTTNEPYEIPIRSKEVLGIGLELLDTEDDIYIFASAAWLDRLPPVFRPQTDYSEGMDFLWREGGQIFPLCFPEVFEAAQVSSASTYMQKNHPEAYRVFKLGAEATQAEIERAGRGFATDWIEYGFHSVLSENENGDAIVLAVVSLRFGPQEKVDDRETLYMFRIPARDVEEHGFRIDQDRHECLGKYKRPGSETAA